MLELRPLNGVNMIKTELKQALRELLLKEAFSVGFNEEILGNSGLKHVFDVVARRERLTLCFDFIEGDSVSLLKGLGKTLDVNSARVFLLMESRGKDAKTYTIETCSVIVYRDLEDMLTTVEELLVKEGLARAGR